MLAQAKKIDLWISDKSGCTLRQKFYDRVKDYTLEVLTGNDWKEVHHGQVIGHKQIIRFDPIEASAVRLRLNRAEGEPLIRKLWIGRVPTKPATP